MDDRTPHLAPDAEAVAPDFQLEFRLEPISPDRETTMTRCFLAASLALAFLAGCTTQTTSAALTAAEAVVTDIVSLEQQVQASGATVTPAELAALTNAVVAAQAGVVQLTRDSSQAPSVLAGITAALQQIEPFLPEIAAVIGIFATPTSSVAAVPARTFPALVQLQADMKQLRAAA